MEKVKAIALGAFNFAVGAVESHPKITIGLLAALLVLFLVR